MLAQKEETSRRISLRTGASAVPLNSRWDRIKGICAEPLVIGTAAVTCFAAVASAICDIPPADGAAAVLFVSSFFSTFKGMTGFVDDDGLLPCADEKRTGEVYDFSDAYIENAPLKSGDKTEIDFEPIGASITKKNKIWLGISAFGGLALTCFHPLLALGVVPTAVDAFSQLKTINKVKRGEWSVHNIQKRMTTYADYC